MDNRRKSQTVRAGTQDSTKSDGTNIKDRRYTSANKSNVIQSEQGDEDSKASTRTSGGNKAASTKKKKRRNKSRGRIFGGSGEERSQPSDFVNNGSTDDAALGVLSEAFVGTETERSKKTSNEALIESSQGEIKDDVWSPRKQTIMRYKNSDEKLNSDNPISGAKESLRPNTKIFPVKEEPGKPVAPEKLNMDEKVTLFKYHSSKVLMFDEQPDGKKLQSSGRLLGHGELELFQLHNGDVTYLSCGPSFIYPLLPKLKILRVNINQFILPLVNPERYWQITLNTDEVNVVQVLENAFERLVKYRNLYFNIQNNDKIDDSNDPNLPATIKSSNSGLSVVFEGTVSSDENHANTASNLAHLQIADKIPDSPPSVAASPPPQMRLEKTNIIPEAQPLSPEWSLNKKTSNFSITSAMASFDINNAGAKKSNQKSKLSPIKLHQPLPQKHKYMNPYTNIQSSNFHALDEKSDSSNDSLLDEYEEHIAYTKRSSISRPYKQTTQSRHLPPSRLQSLVTPLNRDKKDNNSEDNDKFPKTSLSEYNRVMNGGMSRSRKSSVSDLYASESNWMEPNYIPKSRSTYSVASTSYKGSALNTTYKQIYKSLSYRNMNLLLDEDVGNGKNTNMGKKGFKKPDDLLNKPPSKQNPIYLTEKQRHSSYAANRNYKNYTTNNSKRDQGVKLDSSDIYELISPSSQSQRDARPRRKEKPQSTSIAARLFGW